MAKIKHLDFYGKSELKFMKSFLDYNFPVETGVFHNLLPLRFKFLPESYVAFENDKSVGLISVKRRYGEKDKCRIVRLFLEENYFDVGKQLIDYIVSKYGAMGAVNFSVMADENSKELINIFSNGCGFKFCSHKNLYKISMDKNFANCDFTPFQTFKNSDAKEVCELYNELLNPQFKTSLSKSKEAFCSDFFKGLKEKISFSYILSNSQNKSIAGFFTITSYDDKNFTIDFFLNGAFEEYFSSIIRFSTFQIQKRHKNFELFINLDGYFVNSNNFEQKVSDNNLKFVQKQIILIKDFYKSVEEKDYLKNSAIIFNDIKGSPAFKSPLKN